MRGTLVRGTRLSPFVGATLFLALGGLVLATGCAETDNPSENPTEAEERSERQTAAPLPAVVTEDRPILPEGPPSAVFADEDFGIEFRHHAFLRRSVAPGRGFGSVTLRYGQGRIVITTYEESMATRDLRSELRLAVERHYRGAVFPPKMPRLTHIGDSTVPQRPTEGETMTWEVGRPDSLGAEEEALEEHLQYNELRRASWDGPDSSDQFKRRESWLLETETWTSFERTAKGIEFQGLNGVAYVDGKRYRVTLEAAGDIHRPVHIVYFYPYEDYPVMREVIATLHESLRIN